MTTLFIEYLKSEHPHTILRKRHNPELNSAFNIAQGIIRQQTKIVIIDTDKIVTECLSRINDPVTFKRIHDELYNTIIEYITTHPNVYGLVLVCDQTYQDIQTRSDTSGAMATDPEVFGMMTNSVTHDKKEAWMDMRMRPWNLTAIIEPVLTRIADYMATADKTLFIMTTFMFHDYKTQKSLYNKWSITKGTVTKSFLASIVTQYPSATRQTIHVIEQFIRGDNIIAVSVYTNNKDMLIALSMRDAKNREVAVCINDTITSINGVRESIKGRVETVIERVCLVDEYISKNKTKIPRMRSDAIRLIKDTSIDIVSFASENYSEIISEEDGKTTKAVIDNLTTTNVIALINLIYQSRFIWGKNFISKENKSLDTRIASEITNFALEPYGMKFDYITTLFPEWYDELRSRLMEFESTKGYMCVSLLFQYIFVREQIAKDTYKVNWTSDNVARLMSNKGRRYILPVTTTSKKDIYTACQEARTVDAERVAWEYEAAKPLNPSEYTDEEFDMFDGTLSSSHDVCEYALPFIKIDARDKLYDAIIKKIVLFKTLMENSYLSYLLFRREYDQIYRGKALDFGAENLIKITESNNVLSEQPLFATFIFAWMHHKNVSITSMQRAKTDKDIEEVYRKIKTIIAESRETLETVHATFPSAHNLRFAINSQRVMLFFANWPRAAILTYIKQSVVNKENITEMYKGLLFIDKKTMPVVFYDVSFPFDSAQDSAVSV